jgi:hypothetical protein
VSGCFKPWVRNGAATRLFEEVLFTLALNVLAECTIPMCNVWHNVLAGIADIATSVHRYLVGLPLGCLKSCASAMDQKLQ